MSLALLRYFTVQIMNGKSPSLTIYAIPPIFIKAVINRLTKRLSIYFPNQRILSPLSSNAVSRGPKVELLFIATTRPKSDTSLNPKVKSVLCVDLEVRKLHSLLTC